MVELADSEQFATLPRELVRCRFPLSDGGDNPPWLLRLASESVAALLRAGIPTLVCCAGGLSRSVRRGRRRARLYLYTVPDEGEVRRPLAPPYFPS